MYTIGEISEMFNLPISTLRYYDKEGLFPTITRKNGIRVFTDKEVEQVKIIECLKSTGLSIKDIKQYMIWNEEGDSTLEKRRDLFYKQLEVVKKQMKAIENTMTIIKFKCSYYDEALKHGTEKSIIEHMKGKML